MSKLKVEQHYGSGLIWQKVLSKKKKNRKKEGNMSSHGTNKKSSFQLHQAYQKTSSFPKN